MRHYMKIALASAALLAFSGAAQAAEYPSCSVNDISPTASACAGFVGGNLLSGKASDVAAAQTLLAEIGFTGDAANRLEILSPLNGSHTVDFQTLLSGDTFIGLHFGNGRGSPGNPDGDTTAFYRFDAGAGLDQFFITSYNASSNAVLYRTTVAGVPEPGTWAMMLLGFGAMGASMRRRRPTTRLLHVA
jgi:hypothetical protein